MVGERTNVTGSARFAKLILGDDFDIDTHFRPSYRHWTQRIAVVPDGDLFVGIREGKVSVVTDQIERFTETGILTRSGELLEADIRHLDGAPWLQELLGETIEALRADSTCVDAGAATAAAERLITADQVAAHADFFSFGTNDLTQMTFGFSRDDVEAVIVPEYLRLGLLPANPFETLDVDGVGIEAATGRADRPAHR